MQRKLYIGGLPWELDRVGVLNYVKAIFEGNDIVASYELPFVSAPVIHPNSAVRVTDIFVAMDRATGKSRGFGFVTLEFSDASVEETLFTTIVELLNQRIVIGIRGPRELIVNEADEQKPAEERNNDRGKEEVSDVVEEEEESDVDGDSLF